MNLVRGAADARRAQYLAALGIDLWTARARAAPACLPVAAPEAAPEAVGSPEIAGEVSTLGWESLRTAVAGCRRCGLCEGRTQTVFGVGDPRAQVLVVGEAPGAEEDRQGEPFVGRAGQLLNAMLRALGQPRERVYIANILKCRPPGNRDPSPAEVASCLPFLHRQIELLAPRLILIVGRIAAQSLLATDTSIGRLRGHLHRYGAQGTPMLVTYHPAYLLRSPSEKRRAWSDLKSARAQLALAAGA
jgi:DNA polymerase